MAKDEISQEVQEQLDEMQNAAYEKANIDPDKPLSITPKQLNQIILASTTSTAKVYTEKLQNIMVNFKEEVKTYIETEFLQEFQSIEDVKAALDRIHKLETTLTIHTKYLDKHEALLTEETP